MATSSYANAVSGTGGTVADVIVDSTAMLDGDLSSGASVVGANSWTEEHAATMPNMTIANHRIQHQAMPCGG